MKVYAIIQYHHHEGGDVQGIYFDKFYAEKLAKELQEKEKHRVSWFVEEHEVIEKEMSQEKHDRIKEDCECRQQIVGEEISTCLHVDYPVSMICCVESCR